MDSHSSHHRTSTTAWAVSASGIFTKYWSGSVTQVIFDSPMKRRELIRWLTKQDAQLIREGRRHSIWGKGLYRTQIPRHTEVMDLLARKICRDLDIPFKEK